jgi:uncharacterized protein (TIGR03437 family)
LNDTTGLAGSTVNMGLAVDAAGNAFVTGTLLEATYPLTVATPSNYSGYLSKLDPTGSSLLFSVPIGGGGVVLDSSGALYLGGTVSSYSPVGLNAPVTPVAPPAIFSWVPQQCWPDNIVAFSEAYVMKVDPATGNALDAQWIDGSTLTTVGITLAGGDVWITGSATGPDVPFTSGTLSPKSLGPGFTSGAYVAAADFSTNSAAGAPMLACVLDAGNLEHVRAVAPYQVISLFGTNLGPSTGVAAPDGTDPSVAGVTVTLGGTPAQLQYVSSSQINVVVPLVSSSPVMQVTVNGATAPPRALPLVETNLNLFANLASNEVSCPGGTINANGFQPLAMNADGSLNSCANPAKPGSTVSFFIDGVGTIGGQLPPPTLPVGLLALVSECWAPVQSTTLIDGFVYQVDVQLPTSTSCILQYGSGGAAFGVTLSYNGVPIGPLVVPPPSGPIVNFTPGQPMPMIVWATK